MRRLSWIALAAMSMVVLCPQIRKIFSQDAPLRYSDTTYATYQFNTLKHPTGLLFGSCPGTASSCLYIADSDNHVIRRFDTFAGTLSVVAGTVGQPGYANGASASALFRHPTGLVGAAVKGFNPFTGRFYSYAYLYVSDGTNYVLRSICQGILFSGSSCDSVTTVAGNHTQGFADGSSLSAAFAALGGSAPPAGVDSAVAPPFYICDSQNHSIRYWDGSNVSTFAGTGQFGYVQGYRTAAQFNCPTQMDWDTNGNMYVADMGNNVIRKIDPFGNVTTFAGTGQAGYVDGPATVAQFFMPSSIAFYNGLLYVTDSMNNSIRQIDLSGNVTTYAGSTDGGLTDGALSAARFACPMRLLILNGVMYVSDTNNNVIRRIDMTAGVVSTYIT